jgi:hypothetical protein
MTPYLVRVRIPGAGVTPEGPMTIYIACFETEQEALDAVKRAVPDHWTLEEVIGQASDAIVTRRKLRPGSVEQL